MADARRWLTVSLGVGVVLGMMDACIILDPDHCKTDGDCSAGMVCDPCVAASPGVDGCVAAADRLDTDLTVDKCQAAEGSATTDDDTTVGMETMTTTTEPMATDTIIDVDTTATDDGTDTSTTTGPPVDCMEADGELGAVCPENVPFCVDGTCVGCTNPLAGGCAETGAPGGDVCDDSGACVVCNENDATACSDGTPACDPMTNLCVPCTEHTQCGMSACNLFDGTCVAGPVVTVGVGQPDLASAVTGLGGGGGTIIVVQDTYDETVIVNGGATIAFLAELGQTPVWQRTLNAGAPQLRVTGGSTVLIDGIDLRSNDSAVDPALRVDGAGSRLWVDRSAIVQNVGQAVSAESSATVVLRNCFVGGAVDLAAINVAASNLDLQYSTVGAGTADALAIGCAGASTVTVSDSIVISRGDGPEVVCAPLVATRSASNTAFPNGMDNQEVGGTMTGWFAGYNTGDFHLTMEGQGVFEGIARWNDDDASVDIDGQDRSGVEGTPEHAGADFIP